MAETKPTSAQQGSFVQGLGLWDATAIVMGSMIGSGIFIVSADIGRQVGSPGLLMMTWFITAVMSLILALCYGELAAMMPSAGGQYVYLREAFGKLPAFLYGWVLFFVIQTGTLAAVAVAFAKFSGVFFPTIAADNIVADLGFFRINTQQLLAISILVFLSWLNTRGVKEASIIQNLFTAAKTIALLGLIGLGLLHSGAPETSANFSNMWTGIDWSMAVKLVGVAMVGSLFSADGIANVTMTAGETRNPKRNVPLSLLMGIGTVVGLYILANFAYLNVLPFEQIKTAPEDRVGTLAAQTILGDKAKWFMAAAIMISTFGCVNGYVLTGARSFWMMAQDGLFFRRAGVLDPKTNVPVFGLAIQCVWACLLTLSGKYGDLLDYVIFVALLIYMATVVGLMRLRRTRPQAERPYKVWGYPVLPLLYLGLAGVISTLLLLYKPQYTWPGLLLVISGVPVYFWMNRNQLQRN
jgi:basic amino acid/polyamine antiporter, APA family